LPGERRSGEIPTASGNEIPGRTERNFGNEKSITSRICYLDGHDRLAKADPVPLSTYADANGFIDVQTLTCGQLANTYQEDANALTSWYSGWYNGLAHKHFADFKKGHEVEHQVIEYCKAHPEQRIIHAIGVMLKEDRAEGMMQEK
jgi:HdeA/HdeB family